MTGGYVRPRGAAAYTGLSVSTLAQWRAAGQGPAYSKRGGSILYAIADLDAWLAEGRVEPQPA